MNETIPATVNEGEIGFPHLVCLGASAGGLEALQEFFDGIPDNIGLPFVVVVHLSPDFKSLMPELLSKHTNMPIQAAEEDTRIQNDHVYIIPPSNNMVLEEGRLRLYPQDRKPGHTLNLPIDICLRSLAREYQDRAIAVILSGTGSDGTRGARSVREVDGVVLVQTPESAKFDGMPLSVINAGLADEQASPSGLAARIIDLVRQPTASAQGSPAEIQTELLLQILSLLKEEAGIDASHYRQSMVLRRIGRRMALQGVEQLEDYANRLVTDKSELRRLGDDMLIGVTSFFRDRKAYDALESQVLQQMLLNVPANKPVRVWVAGCSKGDEVYSLLMSILESMEQSGIDRDIKVFATDIDQRALEFASNGRYNLSEAADIPADLLGRYFEKDNDEFRIRPQLRDKVIFAKHNLVTDPPFTRMNLVSCRNLLIYLEPEAQLRVLTSLFTSMKPDEGILFLGSAELPGPIESGLECIDRKANVYRRVGSLPENIVPRHTMQQPISVIQPPARPVMTTENTRLKAQAAQLRRVLEVSFEEASSSAAVINQEGELVEVLTDPLELFRFPKGKPTADISRIFSGEILAAVATAQQQIISGKNSASYSCSVQPGSEEKVRVSLRHLETKAGVSGGIILLTLTLRERVEGSSEEIESIDADSAQRISALEFELRQTKESLQATIEELQSSNEEQQSTNEELIASNEELQSTNEELQSMNEELYTVNTEYNRQNQELKTLTADLNSLLESINIETVYLDHALKIRKFTSTKSGVFSLQPSDIGRSIKELAHQLDVDLVKTAKAVLSNEKPEEREVRGLNGAWILMRLVPHQGTDETDHGVLATFLDVSHIKNAEETARLMGERLIQTNANLAHQTEQLEDLFSIVAHDLRRPVMGLDGTLTLADRKLGKDKSQEASAHIKQALETMVVLKRMLGDLGDVSQISRAEPKTELVELQPWLESVLHPFIPRAKQHGVTLNWIADGGTQQFARVAAETIVNNLVENALIHGTTDKKPKIDVTCQVVGPNMRLTVSDNGEGIAPEHHERVFEIFRQLNANNNEGSGVGLVAARRFADRAGGRLWVESELGQGAKFVAEIPRSGPAITQSKPDPKAILLVEDDSLDAKQVREVLTDHDIHWVRSLDEAGIALKSAGFRLLILDLSLPDGHGLSLLPDIDNSMPVILLSSHIEGIPDNIENATNVVGTIDKEAIGSLAFVELVHSHLNGQDANL